jgi:diguanylate cyclase (GGDEF)-like protein
MTSADNNGNRLADDYIICPVEISRLINPPEIEKSPSAASYTRPSKPVTEPPAERIDTKDKKIQAYQEKIEKLEQLVVTDELTGLKNRRYFLEFAKQILNKARREGKQVTILMFDIDNFKHYNDVYGHSAGDDILKQAGILMRRCCRQHDVVARIGGDEFAVIFWELPNKDKAGQPPKERRSRSEHPEEAIFISKRFCRELKDTELDSLGPEGKGVLTISGGLATFPRDGSNTEQLLKQADNALLDAKQSGKNRIYLVGKSENNISSIG